MSKETRYINKWEWWSPHDTIKPMYTSKETLIYVKRDPHIWIKKTHIYVQRDPYIRQKRPKHTSKEAQIYAKRDPPKETNIKSKEIQIFQLKRIIKPTSVLWDSFFFFIHICLVISSHNALLRGKMETQRVNESYMWVSFVVYVGLMYDKRDPHIWIHLVKNQQEHWLGRFEYQRRWEPSRTSFSLGEDGSLHEMDSYMWVSFVVY